MNRCDVLVVGGGPTGLMMAAELARYGLDCRIIDKNLAPVQESRALAIQPRTMEIFHFLGIDSEFLQQGKQVKALNILGEQAQVGRIELSSLDSPFPFILSLPQSETEEILAGYLKRFGLSVERGCELVGIEETESSVVAEISSEHGPFKVESRWVVGCDGAHSFTRKHLGLSFKGRAFPAVFSLADVQVDWKYPQDEGAIFWHPEGILAAIPLPSPHRYRLIFQLPRCQTSSNPGGEDNLQVSDPPSLEEVQALVQRYSGSKAMVSQPRWLANFHVNSRLASHYQKGKLFLAGDAAHIHSPVGGQGMNTGIQDAFNLAWKMAFVHQGKLSQSILESYHEERHGVAETLLKGTEMGTYLVTLKRGWERTVRNFLASCLLKVPLIQRKVIKAVSQIGITYPHSPMIQEKGRWKRGPKVGSRAPAFPFKREDRGFWALLFPGERQESLEPLIRQIKGLPIPLQVTTIMLTSAEKEIYNAFGVEREGCYVIRPDTYVGYRQTPIDGEALIAYLRQYE